MKKILRSLPLLAVLGLLLSGCAATDAVKKLTSNGFNFVASVGTNAIGILDIAKPIVQDTSHPNDPTAVVVNPAIVSSAQSAAVAFGGPYGVPIAAGIALIAGIAGTMVTQSRRNKAQQPNAPANPS